MTRTTFEHEMKVLTESLEEMGLQIEHAFDVLFEAIEKMDENTLQDIIDRDHLINDMEYNIEGRCLALITRQQPIAKDLRTVYATLKVVTDMERAGDQAADIAELFLRLKDTNLSDYSVHIPKMIEETKKLIHNAVDAFVKRDKEAGAAVIKGDDVVDDLFNKVKEDIVETLKKENCNIDDCVDVLMIAKYLEKVGDHAENIGEWEIFQEKGSINEFRLL